MSKANPILLIAAAAVDAVADGAPLPRIRLLPMGDVKLRDARGTFVLKDRAHAEAVVAATIARAGSADIMIDYDHQSLATAGESDPKAAARALAAGWIKPSSLTVEDDGIWAEPEWTAAASQHLAAREYRYISPLFYANRATRAVTSLQNVALSNTPAITSLGAIAASQLQMETEMDASKIALAAGLAATAGEAEIVAKVTALVAASTSLVAAAATLGLGADATAEQLVAAAARPDPAKYVPIAAFADLQKSVAALQTASAEEKAEQLVAAAMQAGKISPAMKDWAESYAKSDAAGFAKYLEGAPVLVAAGAQFDHLGAGAAADAAAHGLTADELKVAASMGITVEDFAKTKKEG